MEPFFRSFLGYPPQISFFNTAWIGTRRGPPNFDPQKGSKNRHILQVVRLSFLQIIGVDIDVRAPPRTPPRKTPPDASKSPPRMTEMSHRSHDEEDGGSGDGGMGGGGMQMMMMPGGDVVLGL